MSDNAWPKELRVSKDKRSLTISFDDGEAFTLRVNEALSKNSPQLITAATYNKGADAELVKQQNEMMHSFDLSQIPELETRSYKFDELTMLRAECLFVCLSPLIKTGNSN